MSNSTISAMPPADLPLSTEPVPVVQGGANKRAAPPAFGIPIAAATAPTALAQYQTWIDTSASPPVLKMYIGSSWVALYSIATTGPTPGALALQHPATLAAAPTSALQVATKSYVDDAPSLGRLVYKGQIDCSTNPNYPASDQGHLYACGTAGLIGGPLGIAVRAGDLFLCKVDSTASGTQLSVGASWTIIHGNRFPMTGPASSVDGDFALFDGTSGKAVKDGGISLDTDPTMAAASDTRVPSQKAVRSSSGGLLLGPDVPTQGQGWLWDPVSVELRARDCEGENLLVNSAFDVWQENTIYAVGPSAPKFHAADFWKVGTNGGSQKSISRVAGLSGAQYALKFQRNQGTTDANRIRIVQQFGTAESLYLAGKAVTVSFDFTPGANFSTTVGPYVFLLYGTGTEEDLDLRSGTINFPTGGAQVFSILTAQVPAAGAVKRIIAPPLTFLAGSTECALMISSGAFSGAAGADDSFTIGNVKLEVGNIATPYVKPDMVGELKRCQRRYWKSFVQGTVPAQGAGAGTSEHRAAAVKSGASAQTLGTVRTGTMRAVPTVTLFNPVSSNAQVRNLTANVDCGATAVQNISDSGFEIVATGNASTAIGDTLGVHAVADARL